MDIDPKGQPTPPQPLSDNSEPASTAEETATGLNRQLEKTPETTVSTSSSPSDPARPDSPVIEARLVAVYPSISGTQQETVVQFMDFIREQGQRCLRPDVDALMNRLFEWFKPELSIHGDLTDSAIDSFIQQSPEHARALLFLATTILPDDEEKALRLVTRVAESAPEAISELLFRWQTIQGIVNAGSDENVDMLRIFYDSMKLAALDDYMGVWLLHLIKQGFVKGIEYAAQPVALADSDRQYTLINRVCRGPYLDEKNSTIEEKARDCILLMMCDPLSFGLLDLLPKLKEPTPELIQITRNISSDSDEEFRYILLPWFITKCSSLLSGVSGYDTSFPFFVSRLGGDCAATDLIKPLWGVYEAVVVDIMKSIIRRSEIHEATTEIREHAKVKPKNVSERIHELRTRRKIAAERKRISEEETNYDEQWLEKIKALKQTLAERLASETSFSPYYQGLLWYYKGLMHQIQLFSDSFPGDQAADCYLEAASRSIGDFYPLFHVAADVYCSRGNYAAAAEAISHLVDFFRTFPPNEALDIVEASQRAYQAKSEEIKNLQALSLLPPEVTARLNAQGIDPDWLPEGQLNPTKEPVKTKKKTRKKSHKTHRSKQTVPAATTPAKTTKEPSGIAELSTPSSAEVAATPQSSGRPSSESRKQAERASGRLTALLPQYWPDDIHREMKNIAMSLYDPFEELEILEKLQIKYDKQAGVERIYEECAWTLIRIQKQPDTACVYTGHENYARASLEILDEAESFLNRALCRKLGVGLSELPKEPAACTILADQRASLFDSEKDRTSYLTGFSCIMQSLGHVRYQREEFVSRGGRHAAQLLTRDSYGQKISIRSRGNPT